MYGWFVSKDDGLIDVERDPDGFGIDINLDPRLFQGDWDLMGADGFGPLYVIGITLSMLIFGFGPIVALLWYLFRR